MQRGTVDQVKHYNESAGQLRTDFLYSCAYCTITEAEAAGINFTIDHYRPRRSHPELEKSYDNLMYCCRSCNSYKGDRDPPQAAQASGVRFFRPDQDVRHEHFTLDELELVEESDIGGFTIDAVDLNRQVLRRVRDLRRRFNACDEFVAEGISALLNFRVDGLAPQARARALKAREQLIGSVDSLQDDIDEFLRASAKSGLLDPDPEAEKRFRERTSKLRGYEAIFPGSWRGRVLIEIGDNSAVGRPAPSSASTKSVDRMSPAITSPLRVSTTFMQVSMSKAWAIALST